MLIVAEPINASRKAIKTAIDKQYGDGIKTAARDQIEAGAHCIDITAGVFVSQEPEYLKWLVTTVQSEVDQSCCINGMDPKAIEAALAVHDGTAMINSISLNKDR